MLINVDMVGIEHQHWVLTGAWGLAVRRGFWLIKLKCTRQGRNSPTIGVDGENGAPTAELVMSAPAFHRGPFLLPVHFL